MKGSLNGNCLHNRSWAKSRMAQNQDYFQCTNFNFFSSRQCRVPQRFLLCCCCCFFFRGEIERFLLRRFRVIFVVVNPKGKPRFGAIISGFDAIFLHAAVFFSCFLESSLTLCLHKYSVSSYVSDLESLWAVAMRAHKKKPTQPLKLLHGNFNRVTYVIGLIKCKFFESMFIVASQSHPKKKAMFK